MTTRVLLLPGIWLPALAMRWFAARVSEAGFTPEPFGYSGVREGSDAAIHKLVEHIRNTASEPLHVIAHSLGGLIVLQALQEAPDLPIKRVVCLGAPLAGSAAASGLSQHRWTASLTGRSAELLQRGCPPWEGKTQIGMVAGRTPMGLGRLLGHFEGDNDGTVAVAETRLPGLADHTVIAASHSGLLFSTEAAKQAIAFLQHGRFQAG